MSTAPSPSLNLDILHVVFSHLRGDHRSLRACSLVCSAWVFPSQLLLFEELNCSLQDRQNRQYNIRALHDFLVGAPELARSVRVLRLGTPRVEPEEREHIAMVKVQDIQALLLCLPRLRAVYLVALDLKTIASLLQPMIRRQPMPRLSIDEVHISDMHLHTRLYSLYKLLHMFERIDLLTIAVPQIKANDHLLADEEVNIGLNGTTIFPAEIQVRKLVVTSMRDPQCAIFEDFLSLLDHSIARQPGLRTLSLYPQSPEQVRLFDLCFLNSHASHLDSLICDIQDAVFLDSIHHPIPVRSITAARLDPTLFQFARIAVSNLDKCTVLTKLTLVFTVTSSRFVDHSPLTVSFYSTILTHYIFMIRSCSSRVLQQITLAFVVFSTPRDDVLYALGQAPWGRLDKVICTMFPALQRVRCVIYPNPASTRSTAWLQWQGGETVITTPSPDMSLHLAKMFSEALPHVHARGLLQVFTASEYNMSSMTETLVPVEIPSSE